MGTGTVSKQEVIKPLGLIEMAWNLKLVLPLDKAHQLQTLLCEATRFETSGYNDRERFMYLQEFTPPQVAVADKTTPVYDARMLSEDAVGTWKEAVREGLALDKESHASKIITPEQWKGMKP